MIAQGHRSRCVEPIRRVQQNSSCRKGLTQLADNRLTQNCYFDGPEKIRQGRLGDDGRAELVWLSLNGHAQTIRQQQTVDYGCARLIATQYKERGVARPLVTDFKGEHNGKETH